MGRLRADAKLRLLNKETVSFLGEIVGFGLFYSADVGSVDKTLGIHRVIKKSPCT